MIRTKTLAWLAALSALLAACSSFLRVEQPVAPSFLPLSQDMPLGQTFTARYAGLSGIVLFLQPGTPGDGQVLLHLRQGPGEAADLRTVALPLAEVTAPAFYRFRFPPLPDSTQADFYFLLQIQGAGSLQLGAAPAETYLNGALYQGGAPVEAQAAFMLAHDPWQAGLGVLSEAARWLGWLLVGAFLFLLPGWGLLGCSWTGWDDLPWIAKTALAAGASLAIYPVLFLWTGLIGLRLGALYAWLPPLAGLAALIWKNRKGLAAWRLLHARQGLKSLLARPDFWAQASLVGVTLLLIASRLWAVRSLDLPLWGDSYQHTLLAQLMVENGGLFSNWQPYAELESLTYHFGFHSLLAVFYWITRMPMPQVTLWVGQVVNVLAVLVLAPLALRLSRNPWTAVFALLVGGLASSMPMFYTNWGRYAQLAGQAILPVAVYLAWEGAGQARGWRRGALLAGLLVGGLGLTHYRVILLLAAAYPAIALIPSHPGNTRRRLLWLAASGLLGGLLCLPWLLPPLTGKLGAAYGEMLTQPASPMLGLIREAAVYGDLRRYLPSYLWLLLPVALGWGLWRRNRAAAMLGVWGLLGFLATNPDFLDLPGSGVISNFVLLIAAYLPAGLLGGASAGWLAEDLSRLPLKPDWQKAGRWLQPALALLILAGGLYAARQRLWDINPNQHALATRPDRRAAAWIQANTPPESRFLVNAQFAYGGLAVVGADGGWWLPLLAGRQITVPPLLYLNEHGPHPDYREWVNALYNQVETAGISHPDTLQLLHARGITHVYLGQLQGRVNDQTPMFDPNVLRADPHFQLVYRQDRVWIFAIQE